MCVGKVELTHSHRAGRSEAPPNKRLLISTAVYFLGPFGQEGTYFHWGEVESLKEDLLSDSFDHVQNERRLCLYIKAVTHLNWVQ